MGKTRVGVLLRESIGSSKATVNNSSADLSKLTSDYHVWCKKIRYLVEALKTHLNSLKEIDRTRLLVRIAN